MTLLKTCNADVFAAILDIKENQPVIGEKLISILQNCEEYIDLTCSDMLWFAAHLPISIWDCKVHTFYLLFESQQTTVMP